MALIELSGKTVRDGDEMGNSVATVVSLSCCGRDGAIYRFFRLELNLGVRVHSE